MVVVVVVWWGWGWGWWWHWVEQPPNHVNSYSAAGRAFHSL